VRQKPVVRNRAGRSGVENRVSIAPNAHRKATVSELKITVRPQGPLKVEGDIPLFDAEGNRIPTPEGRPYSLCRCGHSKDKPFCDGSHKTAEWDGSLRKKETQE
jgi:CDGSH-type Zn-finger protein